MHSSNSNRYALAIHTASPDLGLAISNFAGDSRSQAWALGREVSSYLHLYLSKFIQPQTWADLEFIAVAKGPGGFTGTRLGVVTARTLAQQLDLPLFAISTLAAVAWATVAVRSEPELDIAVQMPAQRGEVHAAIYRIHLTDSEHQDTITALLPDAVVSQEQWQQMLADWQRPYRLVQAEGGLGATAESLLTLAYLEWQAGSRPHWSTALPFYGQSPV
ncbi:MAG: tRNA (adenosine(37)-N6)-threonylcarbamoyltransferase complex dimerization subunit type 1 TsaB [Cyanobacteria bacterium RM1_2_2]|nr:tRNA (adenosine(37)-N6)-threonylcarbamoyltransferase complex dimerization subunit type 1 TsaB [Cyanobacteria bacterium RM1_2_2]